MSLLDKPARALPNDRPAFHRLLRSVELSTGRSYMDCYAAFSKGAGHGGGTVGAALRAGGVHELNAIAEDLTTLERADQARDQINKAAAKMLDDAGTGFMPGGAPSSIPTGRPDSRPRIDGPTYATVKEAAAKGLPDYERLHAARKLDRSGAYEGPEGEQAWKAHDLRHAEAGIDLLGTMQQDAGLKQVQQQAGRATQRLDAALRQGKTPAERRRLLDAAVSAELRQLQAPASAAAPRTARQGPLIQLDDGGRSPLSAEAREIAARINAKRPSTQEAWLRCLAEEPCARSTDRSIYTELYLLAVAS